MFDLIAVTVKVFYFGGGRSRFVLCVWRRGGVRGPTMIMSGIDVGFGLDGRGMSDLGSCIVGFLGGRVGCGRF